jgi:response regulator RpfG family c-di-GMP phosphodiesterase
MAKKKEKTITEDIFKYKLMIVDDEPDIHTITQTVLKKFEFEGHGLEIINAYSAKEAYELLKKNQDTAIMLLDVVMESDDAGLKLVPLIRDELNNGDVRIILRTGQPGTAPEKEIIHDYDINDYKEKSELTIVKLYTALVASLRSYENIQAIKKLNIELLATQREVLRKLGNTIESRSKETGEHVQRVAGLSYLLARYSGLPQKEAQAIEFASPMHDLGKIAIPDTILLKAGPFDDAEYETMKAHAKIGYEILHDTDKDILKIAAIIAHEHHEKWDGSGYPRGLNGEDIHIYGRITALADVFDALTQDRVYKKAWPLEKIYKLLKEEKAKHFDPKLVDLFFDNLDEILEKVYSIER